MSKSMKLVLNGRVEDVVLHRTIDLTGDHVMNNAWGRLGEHKLDLVWTHVRGRVANYFILQKRRR